VKKISFILIVAIFASSMLGICNNESAVNAASIENNLYFCENFDNVTTGIVPTFTYTQNGNSILIEDTGDGNQSLAFSVLTNQNASIQKTMDANRLYGKVVFDMDFMFKSHSGCSKQFIIRNKKYGYFVPFTVNGAGDVITPTGKIVATLSEDVFHRISLTVDIDAKTYSMYIDGIERLKDGIITNTDFEEIAYINFEITSVTSDCTSKWYLDNFRIYSGTRPLSDEEFESKKWNLVTEFDAWFSDWMVKEFLKDTLTFYVGSERALNNGVTETLDCAPYINEDTTMVPIRYIAESLGATVIFNESGSSATIRLNGKEIVVTAGSNKISVDGAELEMQKSAIIKNNRFFVPLRTMGELAGKEVYWDDSGLIILSDDPIDINWYDDPFLLNAIIAPIVYDRPSGAEIINSVKERYPNQSHPRLYATKETFDAIKREIATSDTKAKWAADIIARADDYLNKPLWDYEGMDNKENIIIIGDYFIPFVDDCAFAYKITGDTRYAERVARELENMADIPSYAPTKSMLYVTRLVMAMAKAYDWTYEYLTPEIRAKVEDAIVNKMFPYLIEDYHDINVTRGYAWAQAKMGDNWNVICNNAAIQSAIAICDKPGYEKACEQILDEAVISIEKTFNMLAPDGAWYEGPAYWTATSDNIAWTITCFETATGDDYGFSDVPGIDGAGYFLAYMRGEDYGFFNYNMGGDFNSYNPYAPSLVSEIFYSELYNDPALLAEYVSIKRNLDAPGTWEDLVYTRADVDSLPSKELPLDKYFASSEVVTMRNTWAQDDTMFFAGLQSGQNDCPNSQLDVGTFVIDAYGTRFISDLGIENYNLAGYYEKYRLRAEGNNCILINPDTNFNDQNPEAYCYIDEFDSNDISAYAITDMTDAYPGKATSIKRGMKMTNNRTALVLQDEIRCPEPSEIYWGAHTRANVEIVDDKTVILERDGLLMEAKILGEDGTFSTMEAAPIPGKTFEWPGQTVNEGVTKLTVHFENVESVDLVICFTPLSNISGVNIVYPEVKPLSEWSLDTAGEVGETIVPVASQYALTSLTLDGETIEGFEPEKNVYNVVLPQRTSPMPKVEATADGATVSVEYPESWPAPIKVIVKNDSGYSTKTINFEKPPVQVSDATHEIIAIEASECKEWTQEPYNSPEESYDNNFDTRFSGGTQIDGGNHIIYDLGEIKKVDSVGMAFYYGSQRRTYIQIMTSKDKVTWETVFDGASNGTTDDFEYFEVSKDARYIKVVGFGTDQIGSPWLSIVEFKAFEKKPHMIYNPFSQNNAEVTKVLAVYENDDTVMSDISYSSQTIYDGAVLTSKANATENSSSAKSFILKHQSLAPVKEADVLK